jgi:hypothetical protein
MNAPRTGRRRWTGVVGALVIGVLLVVLASRMVPHPVGAARTYDKYASKAVTTARGAESDVQTALLVSGAASGGNAFGPYTSLVLSDAEDGVSGLQGTFDSIQPPDARADELADELDGILSGALGQLRTLRIAARRGDLSELDDLARPLHSYARQLEAFQERHQ